MNKEKKRVLRERAGALAGEEKAGEVSDSIVEAVEFTLASEHYAFEAEHVREVCGLKDYTPLPCTPSFVCGLINVRGQVLSVVDLRRIFDLPGEAVPSPPKALILRHDEMEFGVLAESVVGSRRVDLAGLRPALPTLTGIRAEYLKGITGEGLIVLDAVKLLGDKGLIVNEEVLI